MAKRGTKKSRDYKIGDLVLVYAHEGIYEAKILTVRKNVDRKSMPVLYFVHYQGWKNKWDEWITKDVMMENTQENKQYKKEYMKRKDILRKRKLKQGTGGSKSRKKREENSAAEEDNTEFEDASQEEESQNIFKLNMSEGFKNLLVKDWERITQQKKIVELPRKPHVHAVLQRFLKHALNKKLTTQGEKVLRSLVKGLEHYFNRSLGTILLYPFERLQYESILERQNVDFVTPAKIYGAEHLLRLMVKLPILLQDLVLEKSELQLLQSKVEELMRFLVRNDKEFFDSGAYVKASPDYAAAFIELSKEKVAVKA